MSQRYTRYGARMHMQQQPLVHLYGKLMYKLSVEKARQVFLLKCRRHDIIPRFILDKTKHLEAKKDQPRNVMLSNENMLSKLRTSLLNIEISSCCYSLQKLVDNIDQNKQQIIEQWAIQAPNFIQEQDQIFKKNLTSNNKSLFEKFERLKKAQDVNDDIHYDEKFVKNISGEQVPTEMMILLGLGPKFAVLPHNFPSLDIVTDVEFIISRFAEEPIKKAVRGQLAYTITKFTKTKIRPNRIQKFLLRAIRITTKFLQQHPDVFISSSDKGGVTVIANKHEYHRKLGLLLEDEDTFKKLDADFTQRMQTKNNKLVKRLFEEKHITLMQKKQLTTYTAIPPRIFAQFKVHKEGYPVRPIVSTINSPSYKLSKLLATILRKSFGKPKYNLKNSAQFVKRIRGKRIKPGNRLLSFDVVNCFTNIPTNLAMEIIERRFDEIQKHTSIPKALFMELLDFCLHENNFFVYNNTFYRQIKGLFMGSSIAPILVELVLEDTVDSTIEAIPEAQKPEFWFSFVDDHVTSIPEDQVDDVLDKLNSKHPSVQFTSEIEENSRLNYLDVTIVRTNENGLITDWYCKPMATNRILNYFSAHPQQMIENVASNLVKKVLSLSHRSFHKENLGKINKILHDNNFPSRVIDKIINKVFSSKGVNPDPEATINRTFPNNQSYPFLETTTMDRSDIEQETGNIEPQHVNYCSMTYIPQLTDTLKGQIKYFIPSVKLAPKPPYKNDQFFAGLKQKIKKEEKAGVVYKISCNDCPTVYIGETLQKLGKRVGQHRNDCTKTDTNKNTTALARHSIDEKHQFNFDDVEILQTERIKRRLQIQEINQIILNEDNACNYKTDSQHVSPGFYNLVKGHKNWKIIETPNSSMNESMV